MPDKPNTSLRLSREALRLLHAMSERDGLPRAAFLEQLLRQRARELRIAGYEPTPPVGSVAAYRPPAEFGAVLESSDGLTRFVSPSE